jgi:SRSO17 transposase
VEPIALEAGVPVRTLQEFLSWHRWDDRSMRDRVQEIVRKEHAHPHAIGVIDETSLPKKGDRTPGVQRQWCGATGKKDNCVVTVHLGYVARDFHALLDGDLFLPEQTWGGDRARCRAAGIPDDVVYRPKWRIALELLEGAVRRGVRMEWLVADELYGRAAAFRRGVADLGVHYVVEVPCDLTGWTATRLPEAGTRRIDRLWERGGPPWEKWRIKHTEKGWCVCEVRALRFVPVEEGIAGEEGWLLVARNVLDGSVKYFLSDAPEGTPVGTLLHVAFSRWHIERLFQEGKSEVGFDHFEGRTYTGLMRHMVLTAVSLLFLAKQRQRIREKKGDPTSLSNSFASPWNASSSPDCREESAVAG